MSHASCCVLSYNRPTRLKPMLESMVREAGAPLQVIIHDDGSTDPAVYEVLGWAQRDLGATVITNKPGQNEGQGTALNRMFRLASGDPITKLDHDLLFHPGWLNEVQKILARSPLEGELLPLFRRGRKVAEALLDADLVEEAAEHVWRLNDSGYAVRPQGRQVSMLHRWVAVKRRMTRHPGRHEIDHLNRVRLDNRSRNIRVVPAGGNQQNRSSQRGATSGYRGVSWSSRREMWVAQTPYDKQLGFRADEVEAAHLIEAWRRTNMPFAQPDPLLFDGNPPPIGLLGLHRYHHEPVDCAKTILGRGDGWERHSHICGCAFAMTRPAWEAMGAFEEHSESFSEDFAAQQWVHASGLWCCGLPAEQLVENVGFGLGADRSTVVTAPGVVHKIHTEPHVIRP